MTPKALHEMYVRFRTQRRRLHANLMQNRRVEGKIKTLLVASLGSIDAGLSIRDRFAFWSWVHYQLDRLGNRVKRADFRKICAEIGARIPFPTRDDYLIFEAEIHEETREAGRRARELAGRTLANGFDRNP